MRGPPVATLTPDKVFNDRCQPLRIPVNSATMVGQIKPKFALLAELNVEMDTHARIAAPLAASGDLRSIR